MTGKVGEAEELIKKAQKCLKKSLFRQSPDVDSAIEYYGKAAVIYRNARMLKEAADIYKQIADLHAKNNSFFHCAKAYETASFLYRDIGNYNEVVECLKTAGQLMRQNGIADSASILYSKGAKILESQMPEEAAKLYEYAADTSEVEEKYLQAADFASSAARLWTRGQQWGEAERLLRLSVRLAAAADNGAGGEDSRTAQQVCGKAVVALVLIKLAQDDSVAAGSVYGDAVEKYHFGETDDAAAVSRLLQIYESFDPAAAKEVISLPTFRNLELEFARLARTIKFPEGLGQATGVVAAVGGDSGAAAEESEDIC